MKTDTRKEAIRAYWNEHGGGSVGATAGARKIAEQHDIPVNTVRGLQNRMYSGDSKPWHPAPLAACGKCSETAYTDDDVVLTFGYRNMRYTKADGTVKTYRAPQSYCRACKNEARRKAYQRSKQEKTK